jgi:hypothetical protein
MIACALVAWLVGARPGVAQGTTPVTRSLAETIDVRPGATCLDKTRLLAHVKMWLSDPHISEGLRIRVTGDAKDRSHVAYDIEAAGQSGHREFRPAPTSCDDLHALLGLTIALALESPRMARDWLPRPAPKQPIVAAIQASTSFGVLVDAALGLQAGADVPLAPSLQLRLDVLSMFAWDNTISDSRGRFDALLGAAAGAVCAGGWPDQHLRLSVCVGLVAGAVTAWGHGYAPNDSSLGPWVAARSGVRFEVVLGLRWILDLDVISRLYSPAFRATSSGGELRREPGSTGLALSLGPSIVL